MKQRKFDWHKSETGEAVTTSEDNRSWNSAPNCPVCGDKTAYHEFQTGQDFMGNDEYGWNWECFPCGIGTDVNELEDDDYV